jgi:2-oxoisovalerate dehydrogenase E1 component alpha subunit
VGVAGLRVDGNDFLAVHAATTWAAERAHAGHGATLIELVTYRAGAHSTSDDPARYRPKEEFAEWPLGDPIERLKRHLIRLGEWDEARHDHLTHELEQEVTTAWREALRYGSLTEGTRLDPELMFTDVYKEMPEHLRQQYAALQAELAGKTPASGGER